MSLFKFKGGIHPPENKGQTENLSIENILAKKFIYLPLLQNIGSVLTPLVNIGDRVLKGQKIADSTASISSPIHSSVSGKVVKIENLPFTLRGKVTTVVIENDYEEKTVEFERCTNYLEKNREYLLEKIREAGIVGLGGALFPTHIKLNPPHDKKIEKLIINAAECEPYLNNNNRVMIENTKEIVEGIKIAIHILGIKGATIGIEDNKPEAIKALGVILEEEKNIDLAVLKTKYPQGGEKQLIKTICNKHVPTGKLPMDIGVVVINVGTCLAIYNGIIKGEPITSEIVTVSGGAIKNPKNLRVPLGVHIHEILEHVGVDRNEIERLLTGGPMMGITQYTENVPVIKGTSGILALTPKETNPYKTKACISCGKCVEACPMGLSPLMYAKFAQFEKWEEFKEFNIFDCIECGSCQYICPAKRPLTEGIKIGKSKLRIMEAE